MRFRDVLDLARLPYFEAGAGDRLVLADPSLGPTIDMHTHVSQAYVVPSRVDIERETPRTEHYLPVRGRALDLEGYQNRNLTAADLRRMRLDLTLGVFRARGPRATHTLPNLAREMRDLGIAASVLLPIDFPVLSENARTVLRAVAGRPGLVGFGSVHPFARDIEAKLDEQVALGARGIKVHPAVQVVAPDHPRTIRLCRLCGERRLPVLFHCGPVDIEPPLGRRLSQVPRYERAIAECPETVFVLGHSGALQMERALDLAVRYPHVWLELSGQSLANVRRILAEADPDRVVFGTDWPWYPQAIGLAKVFLATEGGPAGLRRQVLYGNAARLLGLEPEPADPSRATMSPGSESRLARVT